MAAAGTGATAAPVIAAGPLRRAIWGPYWALPVAAGVLAAVALSVAVGSPVVNDDTLFHLVWGRELLHGDLDSFAPGPTPHPLLLLSGALTALLGDEGSRVATYVLFGPGALGALVAAVVIIGRAVASAWAGLLSASVLVTGWPVIANAASSRYDVAFAALIMAAVAMEVTRPRRGASTLVVLGVAGLIRPEAWLLAGAYWLWLARSLSWRPRVTMAALVVLAPVVWVAMDTLVMGDPLYSLRVTDRGSDVLYRQYTPLENLGFAAKDLASYVGLVPLLVLPLGAAMLVAGRPRAAIPLLATLGLTAGLFVALLAQGMASSDRYLFVPACVVALLAGVVADGGGRQTRNRVMGAVFVSVFLTYQGVARIDNVNRIGPEAEAVQRQAASAAALAELPGVKQALQHCPAVSLPSVNLVPLFAYHSGRSPDRFRSDGPGRTRPDLYVAPANAEVAEDRLTRERFDDDPTFHVPPTLHPGPRNEDWIIYVSPTSSCARGLLR